MRISVASALAFVHLWWDPSIAASSTPAVATTDATSAAAPTASALASAVERLICSPDRRRTCTLVTITLHAFFFTKEMKQVRVLAVAALAGRRHHIAN